MNGRACSFVRASAVRMCTVQYPYGAWAWAACSLPGGVNCAWVAVVMYIMNGRACLFVRANAVRMCTMPVRARVWAAYRLPGGVYGQNLYWSLCATFSRVYVRYGVRLRQCEQCILYVYVCVYAVGMSSPSVVPLVVSTCVRVLYSIWHGGLGGVRSIHVCYLHVCTVLAPLEQCFGVASTGDVPILPVLGLNVRTVLVRLHSV